MAKRKAYGYSCGGYNQFTLIVVLFILLIIVYLAK
ncbi:YjcZ family sporulation protein [Bacillus sp. C1]